MKLSASILACDSAYLGDGVKSAEKAGAHYIHIDIMDGRYVDNITFGPQTVADLKRITRLPIEVHLEMFEPERYLEMFAKAGTNRLVVQREICCNPIRILNRIRDLKMQAGMAINPGDDVGLLKYLLNYLDFIVIMSVEPGYGGQAFERSCFEKIRKLKAIMKEQNIKVPIAVDGGINVAIGRELKNAGVDILVVGNGLFRTDDIGKTAQAFLADHVVRDIGALKEMDCDALEEG